eukprot:CAMPEP_0179437358 /NCGR_PEP_ID=MMETSP0799-20121207/21263_1 /TAXON_ID=46947 /ORGANISM="Geminigera cryophila, Strain CCMP2564" /LENGTH=821 /DNA_ID=CAMNT_0021218239 /DNA_START=17 /DNA_END=2482 /DNA_ORIENTATION=+
MARPPVPIFGISKPDVPKFSSRDDDDEDKHQSLKIVGYSSSLYQDDETMAWLENQKHLQLWMENKEEDLWIDRYDVRQLLSDASLFAKRPRQQSPVLVDDAEERMLDAERFGDLPPSTGEESSATYDNDGEADDGDGAASAPSNHFGAVHFSFGGQPAAQQAPQHPIPAEIQAFADGWLTELAVGSTLPHTFKQHQVIERTAKFIHKQGKKMEVSLKIKHGGNAAFQFLLVDHPLQPYYQALLKYLGYCPQAADLPTLLPSVEKPAEPAPEAAEEPAAPEQDETQVNDAAVEKETLDVCAPTNDSANASAATAENADEKEEDTASAAGPGLAAADAAEAKGAGGGEANDASERGAESKQTEDDVQPAGQIPIPGPEMLQTIEKLVRWIVKSGRDFEKKVKERQRGDPRFDFLMPWNPYNAFYRQKLDDAFNGKLDDPPPVPSAPAPPPPTNVEPPWRAHADVPAELVALPTPAPAEAAAESDVAVGEVSAGAGESSSSVVEEGAAADAEASTSNVQFITSFGEDSEEEEEEVKEVEQPTPHAESSEKGVDAVSAEPAADGGGEGELAPKKERSSRFGPDLSETEKKAARLARAKHMAGLVKDKVDAVKSAEEVKKSKSAKDEKKKRDHDHDRQSRALPGAAPARAAAAAVARARPAGDAATAAISIAKSSASATEVAAATENAAAPHAVVAAAAAAIETKTETEAGTKITRAAIKITKAAKIVTAAPNARAIAARVAQKERPRTPPRTNVAPQVRAAAAAVDKKSATVPAAAVKKPAAVASSSPPRPSARADDVAASAEGSSVSEELRNKVRAMLAAQMAT